MLRTRHLALLAAVLAAALPAAAHAAVPGQAVPVRLGEAGRTPRIIGGAQAAPGDFPFLTPILVARTGGQFCGGTLIAPGWVLTAAHCMTDEDRPVLGTFALRVAPGAFDLRDLTPATTLPVAQRIVHPDWDPRTQRHDVALLRLGTPSAAPTVTLVGPGDEALWADGATLVTAGWGTTAFGEAAYPAILRRVDVPRASDAACAGAYGSSFDAATMVCAGRPEGGVDSCQGDSGGPLVALDGSTWKQVGVVSFGRGCGLPDVPGVYARVAALRGWIDAVIAGPPATPAAPTAARGTGVLPTTLRVTWQWSGDPATIAAFRVTAGTQTLTVTAGRRTLDVRGVRPGRRSAVKVVAVGTDGSTSAVAAGSGTTPRDRLRPRLRLRAAFVGVDGAGKRYTVVRYTVGDDSKESRETFTVTRDGRRIGSFSVPMGSRSASEPAVAFARLRGAVSGLRVCGVATDRSGKRSDRVCRAVEV